MEILGAIIPPMADTCAILSPPEAIKLDIANSACLCSASIDWAILFSGICWTTIPCSAAAREVWGSSVWYKIIPLPTSPITSVGLIWSIPALFVAKVGLITGGVKLICWLFKFWELDSLWLISSWVCETSVCASWDLLAIVSVCCSVWFSPSVLPCSLLLSPWVSPFWLLVSWLFSFSSTTCWSFSSPSFVGASDFLISWIAWLASLLAVFASSKLGSFFGFFWSCSWFCITLPFSRSLLFGCILLLFSCLLSVSFCVFNWLLLFWGSFLIFSVSSVFTGWSEFWLVTSVVFSVCEFELLFNSLSWLGTILLSSISFPWICSCVFSFSHSVHSLCTELFPFCCTTWVNSCANNSCPSLLPGL